MGAGLTEHERQCLEHMRRARALGMSLVGYERSHGIKARMLYDVAARLKKKGMIGGDVKPEGLVKRCTEAIARDEKSPFVTVRIAPTKAPRGDFIPVLRLSHERGHVLEFGVWPPAEMMAVILAGGHDDTA